MEGWRSPPSRCKGVDLEHLVRGLRSTGNRLPSWDVPPLPAGAPPARFDVTIADLGSFPAESYPARLGAWCRATLVRWTSPTRIG
jgi:hypothetical protein